MLMNTPENKLNHGIKIVEHAEGRFKKLRRKISVWQREGREVSIDILTEIVELDRFLETYKEDWETNFAGSKYDNQTRQKHLRLQTSRFHVSLLESK